VLIKAVPYESRDGRVIVPDDYDIPVRIIAPSGFGEFLADRPRSGDTHRLPAVPPRQRAALLALLRLTQAIQTRDRRSLRTFVKLQFAEEVRRGIEKDAEMSRALGANEWPPGTWSLPDIRRHVAKSLRGRIRFPVSELGRLLNGRLRKARFVMWWVERDKKFAPGIFCEDMATAFAALLVARITSPEGLAVCERCGTQFVRKKQGQRFHDLKCGNAARKARQRSGGRSR